MNENLLEHFQSELSSIKTNILSMLSKIEAHEQYLISVLSAHNIKSRYHIYDVVDIAIYDVQDIIRLYTRYHYEDHLEGGKTQLAVGYYFISASEDVMDAVMDAIKSVNHLKVEIKLSIQKTLNLLQHSVHYIQIVKKQIHPRINWKALYRQIPIVPVTDVLSAITFKKVHNTTNRKISKGGLLKLLNQRRLNADAKGTTRDIAHIATYSDEASFVMRYPNPCTSANLFFKDQARARERFICSMPILVFVKDVKALPNITYNEAKSRKVRSDKKYEGSSLLESMSIFLME